MYLYLLSLNVDEMLRWFRYSSEQNHERNWKNQEEFSLGGIIKMFRQHKSDNMSQIHERVEKRQQCAAQTEKSDFYGMSIVVLEHYLFNTHRLSQISRTYIA